MRNIFFGSEIGRESRCRETKNIAGINNESKSVNQLETRPVKRETLASTGIRKQFRPFLSYVRVIFVTAR
jgi:hypothetical protein